MPFCAQIAEELRERNFGNLELQSHENYVNVWTEDTSSSDYAPSGTTWLGMCARIYAAEQQSWAGYHMTKGPL